MSKAGRDLTLFAQDTLKVRDSVTAPFIASAGGRLLVQGDRIIDIFALNHPASGFFSGGDMVIKSPNSVFGDAHYTTGGTFRIEELDGNLGNLESPGDPVIRASGNVSFNNYTGASLHIFAGGSVNLGSVTITGTDATNFINETVPLSQTLPDGTNTVTINGSTRPTLDIRAGTTAVGTPTNVCVGCPTFQPTNLTFPNTPLTADITIDQIVINRPDGLVFLTNQYQPNPALTGNIQVKSIFLDDAGGSLSGRFNGNGGDVFIDSRGNITLSEGGRIRTDSATGNGGNVTLITNGSFTMSPPSQIVTSISGQGKAGDITINAGDAVSLRNNTNSNIDTLIAANVESGGVGNGGEINIEAGSLEVNSGSIITSQTNGSGNAADLTIETRRLSLRNGSISAVAGTRFTADGTNLIFSASNGRSGDLTVKASESVDISGEPGTTTGGLFTSTFGYGQGGKLVVETGRLTIQDGGRIEASTVGTGVGGTVTVNASESIELIGTSEGRYSSSSEFPLSQ